VKILNLLPRLPSPPVDGGAIAVHQLHTSWLLKDIDIVVASFLSNRHPQDIEKVKELFQVYTCKANWTEFTLLDAFKSLFVGIPYNIKTRFAQQEMIALLHELQSDHSNVDLIQIEWVHMAYYVDLLHELWPQTPIILRSHNVEHVIFERLSKEITNPILAWLYHDQAKKMKYFEANVLQRVDGVITLTDLDERLYKSLFVGFNSKVIPVGIDPSGYNIKEEKTYQGFLILGSMGWAPYAESVLSFVEEVWINHWKHQPTDILHIVGSKPTEELMKYDQKYGINVHGFVEDIQPFLHHSRAMIIPLKSGSGMRIKVLEAVASRCPIISTDVGIEGFPFQNKEHCYIANSLEEWRLGLHTLSSSSTHSLKELSDRAQKLTFPAYDSNLLADTLIEYYKEFL
jgi:glycosyltransferase involved in cell wall biosynthesis